MSIKRYSTRWIPNLKTSAELFRLQSNALFWTPHRLRENIRSPSGNFPSRDSKHRRNGPIHTYISLSPATDNIKQPRPDEIARKRDDVNAAQVSDNTATAGAERCRNNPICGPEKSDKSSASRERDDLGRPIRLWGRGGGRPGEARFLAWRFEGK